MPTVAEVIADEKKIPNARCVVGKAVFSFEDDRDRDELLGLLIGPTSATVVKRVFARLGHSMGETVIRKHRTGECCCP